MLSYEDFSLEENNLISLRLNGYIVKFIAMRSKEKSFYQKNYHDTDNYLIKVAGSTEFENCISITEKNKNLLIKKLCDKLNKPKTRADKFQKTAIIKTIFTKREWFE